MGRDSTGCEPEEVISQAKYHTVSEWLYRTSDLACVTHTLQVDEGEWRHTTQMRCGRPQRALAARGSSRTAVRAFFRVLIVMMMLF